MTYLSLKTKKGSWKVATSWESVLCSPGRITKTWLWPCPTHIIKMLFTRVLCLLSASALRVQEFIPLCFREARKCKWLFKGALYVFALWTLFLSIWGVTLQINLQLLMPDFLVSVSVCGRLAGVGVAAMGQCLLSVTGEPYPWNLNSMALQAMMPAWTGSSHKAPSTVINGSRESETQSPLEKRPLEGYPAPSSHF